MSDIENTDGWEKSSDPYMRKAAHYAEMARRLQSELDAANAKLNQPLDGELAEIEARQSKRNKARGFDAPADAAIEMLDDIDNLLTAVRQQRLSFDMTSRSLEKAHTRIAEQAAEIEEWRQGNVEVNNDNVELRTRNAEFEAALGDARTAIESLTKDGLGTGYVPETGEPYSLRDELIYKLTTALNGGRG